MFHEDVRVVRNTSWSQMGATYGTPGYIIGLSFIVRAAVQNPGAPNTGRTDAIKASRESHEISSFPRFHRNGGLLQQLAMVRSLKPRTHFWRTARFSWAKIVCVNRSIKEIFIPLKQLKSRAIYIISAIVALLIKVLEAKNYFGFRFARACRRKPSKQDNLPIVLMSKGGEGRKSWCLR